MAPLNDGPEIGGLMYIRFVSSLTPDDEDLVAPALLKAIAALLDPLQFAYTLKIETTGSHVLQHTHPAICASNGGEKAPNPRPETRR